MALFLTAPLVSAGIITWGSATDVADSTDVSTNGTTVEALNLGYQAVGLNTVTINGVEFTATVAPAPLTNTTTAAYQQLRYTQGPEVFGTSGDADYDNLLNSIAFGGGGDEFNMTVGGGFLVNGSNYEIQVWFVDERSSTGTDTRQMQIGDGNGNNVLLGNTTGNKLGQYVIGTFTADGTDQTMSLDAQDFGNAHLTAYQIREITSGGSSITWGTPVNIDTDPGNSTDVSTNGTLVEAYNAAVGSYTGGDQTVNGVLFKATTSLLDSDTTSTVDFSAGTNGGDTAYDTILSTLDFGGGESTTLTIGDGDGDTTVTGAGLLQIGETYEIQIWFVDDRVASDSRTMGYASSSTDPVVEVNDHYVIGTFTADTTTQTLYLDTVSPTSGFGNSHLTAYQIRAIGSAPNPTVSLSTASDPVSTAYTVDVSFSEDVTGLDASDFSVTNGTVSDLLPASGPASAYTVLITPTAAGLMTVQLPAGTVINGNSDPNLASNSLEATYEAPAVPSVTIYGAGSTTTTTNRIFLTFSEDVSGLEAGDFVVLNGSVSDVVAEGRARSQVDNSYVASQVHYSALLTADSPGTVEVTLPAGAVTSLDGNSEANTASNTFPFQCTSDFIEAWIIDEAADWTGATSASSNLDISGGFAEPTADSAQFSSVVKSFATRRKATAVTFKQSPVWDNWIPLSYDIQNSVGGDAPILVPAGPDDYYVLALSGSIYHAWHSTDMVNWTQKGPVVSGAEGRWVTSAEYKDGFFYIYSDYANDHTAHVFRDDDLGDGVPGTYIGPVLDREASGSDLAAFRDDADGLFHLIYEDWSPIKASTHSWDSPLAGHVSSADGINGFLEGEHPATVDHRTTPTGTFGSYSHPFIPYDPTYEIHSPVQDAYGDWTAIKVGSQYYIFGDYDPHGQSIRLARFTSDSIHGEFELVGSTITGGHPDPTVGFAEGRFYLITQYNDFYSPGPWVDGVEARAGVDEDGDGTIDTWTGWQAILEQYDYTQGFIRVVARTPAQLDLSSLPSGYGFQFEFRVDDTVVSEVSPIMDKVEMNYELSNFEQWSEDAATVVNPGGDHNGNDIPNLVEFALGQPSLPTRQPDGTLIQTMTSEALADGYTVELHFSEDLKEWTTATSETTNVSLLDSTTLGNGDQEMSFSIHGPTGHMFWRFVVY